MLRMIRAFPHADLFVGKRHLDGSHDSPDGEYQGIDSGLVHVANPTKVVSRHDQEMAMMRRPRVDERHRTIVHRHDIPVRCIRSDHAERACAIHGQPVFLAKGPCHACFRVRMGSACRRISKHMAEQINQDQQSGGHAQQPREEILAHWCLLGVGEGGTAAAFRRVDYRLRSNSLICFSASSLAMP